MKNEERIERASNLLQQAQAVLATVDFPPPSKSAADYFIPTLAANVENEELSDADFRQLVRNSLKTLA